MAGEFGTTVQKAAAVTRVTKPSGALSADAIAAAFNGPQGAVASAAGADPMTRIVLTVDNVTLPPFDPNAADLSDSKDTLNGQFVNAFLSLYVGQLRNATNATYNQAVLNQVIGGGTTDAGG